MTQKLQIVDNFVKTNFIYCIAFCFLSRFDNFCCLIQCVIQCACNHKKLWNQIKNLQLNCHNQAAQNAKETSKSFTKAPSVAEIVPLWSIFFSLGAVEVSPHLFSGVCSLHQRLTGGEVTGVEVSANEVIGGGIGDSIPQADSSLSISWRDPNWLSAVGTHSQNHLNCNCHRETSKSTPSINISFGCTRWIRK